MRILFVIALGAALGVADSSGPASAADGAAIFKKKCGACHALDKNKVGPMLGGIMGRQAGTTDFKRYKGLVNVDFVWDPALMDEYLLDPRAFVKKHTENKRSGMAFKLKDADERAAVIEYLQSTE